MELMEKVEATLLNCTCSVQEWDMVGTWWVAVTLYNSFRLVLKDNILNILKICMAFLSGFLGLEVTLITERAKDPISFHAGS